MNPATWLRIVAILIGGLALAALIWFGGPFLAFGEVRPFESFWVRLPIAVLLMLGALAWIAILVIRRRKATAALTEALEKEETGDGAALSNAMKDALATLKSARGKGGDYLYDLPWYVIIGPPGAGKTTALVNSGLKFPLARGATPAAVTGSGGTRYCDWWFAEDAVLIDTAGRYTTQDTDTKAEKSSWLAFLDLLKTNRPRQPINGVLVAISVEDLLTSSPEEIAAHADAIRARLLELHERLKVDFPVYAVFTKADLIAGFNEFFGALTEPQRRMVWGHTFQTADKTRNMIGDVPPEYDALIERLNERLPDRLQDEHNPTARAQIFGFPSQMATLKRSIVDFLTRVFEPVIKAIPWDLRAKLEPAEVFHQVLEHRWYMSQARGQSVPIAEVVSSYIDDVLRHRRDEATVMGPPTETMAIPVITAAIGTIDDDEDDDVDWRDLV